MSDSVASSTSKRSWEFEVQDSRTLTVLSYAFPSVLGGVVVLVGLLFSRLFLDALLNGNAGQAASYLAFGVLAIFIRRWFVPALLETNLFEPLQSQFSKLGLVLGSICGAFILYASLRLHPFAPFLVFIGSWIPLIITSGFPLEGYVKVDEELFVSKNTEIPLQAVRNYRTFSIGSLVLCWLSYARGVPRAPRTVSVPRDDFTVVQTLLEEATGQESQGDSVIGKPQRWILIVFGIGQLAIGPILWFLLSDGGKLVAVYAGAMFGMIGALMLWYAITA